MKRSGFESMSPFVYPFYTMIHPKDGFQEMKMNRKTSVSVTLLIAGAYVVTEMLSRKFKDFDMNSFDSERVSIVRVFLIMTAMFFMVTASNWCFCTLLDGKGKYKDICHVASCALLPMLIMKLLTILLSHALTIPENIIIFYPNLVAQMWSFLLFFVGLSEIHDYSAKKTLFSILLTAVGILVMLFLSMLLVMLFQQLYYFLMTVIFELKYD